MRYFLTPFIVLACLPAFHACGTALDPDGPGKDNNPRVEIKLSARETQFVTQGNTFAFRFLQQVDKSMAKDYIISPLSMQFLLGMILDGAKGETAADIASVLGYGADETEAVNDYCLSMLGQLPGLDKKTKLLIADAIVVDQGYDLLKNYKETVAKYYKAEVSNLDFTDRKGSADKINKWCSDHTEGLIPHILDETDPDMLCYLLNALYFKSSWSSPFNKQLTREEKFTLADGSTKKAPMMKKTGEFRYGKGTSFEALRIPYGNGAYSMTVFLPANGNTLSDVIGEIGKTGWNAVTQKLHLVEAELWLPKFETKYGEKLNDILSDMGMESSFLPTADFSAMSPDALCLSFVRQDAIIKVDEEGTEAAAVSSAGMAKNTSVGPSTFVVFHADSPFLYVISEQSTGAVLFAGRYGCNP